MLFLWEKAFSFKGALSQRFCCFCEFEVNSALKLLDGTLTCTQNAPARLRERYRLNFSREKKITQSFSSDFLKILFQHLKKLANSNEVSIHSPSLQSVATHESKEFKWSNIIFGNKTRKLSVGFY